MPKLRRSKETAVFPSRVGHLNALAFRRVRRTRRRNLRVGSEIIGSLIARPGVREPPFCLLSDVPTAYRQAAGQGQLKNRQVLRPHGSTFTFALLLS